MFAKAKVRPEDEVGLAKHSMSLVTEHEQPFFSQPCAHQDGGHCRIYDERFSTCRRFKCNLLTSYQEGVLTLDDAREKIVVAKELRATIAKEEPRAALWAERQGLKAQLGSSTRDLTLLINIIALDRFLDRWFRKRPVAKGVDTLKAPTLSQM